MIFSKPQESHSQWISMTQWHSWCSSPLNAPMCTTVTLCSHLRQVQNRDEVDLEVDILGLVNDGAEPLVGISTMKTIGSWIRADSATVAVPESRPTRTLPRVRP